MYSRSVVCVGVNVVYVFAYLFPLSLRAGVNVVVNDCVKFICHCERERSNPAVLNPFVLPRLPRRHYRSSSQ